MGGRITIFGARNPISLDYGLLKHLEFNFYKYEHFISSVQMLDAYYCAPFILEDNNKKNRGIFTFRPDEKLILPIEPELTNAEAPEDYVVDDWFIGNEDGLVKYEDFIKIYEDSPLYDANHIIVEISKNEYEDFIAKYGINLEEL